MKQLGVVTLSRVSSNFRDEYIQIALRGDGEQLVTIELEMTDFAYLVTGRAMTPCEYELAKRENSEPEINSR